MSIPAPSGAAASKWAPSPLAGGAIQYTCVLAGATDVSDLLEVYNLPIQTIHIFGSFNAQNISVLATNSISSSANGQALHRLNDATATFSAVGAELLAAVIECPRYIFAQANGAVTSVSVVITCVDRKAK